MSTQIEFNRECCGCQSEAILEMNSVTNELECTGCDPQGKPLGYDYCQATASSQNYGGFGNFLVDFFQPTTIQAIGGLFGRGSSPYDPNGSTQDSIKKQNRGLGVVIVFIVAVVIFLVVRKRKGKR